MTDDLSPEAADAFLAGSDPAAPLGKALARIAGLAGGPVPEVTGVVAQMSAAASAGSGWFAYAWLLRPRGFVLAKLLIATAATATVATGGLAATGNLPAGLQEVAANAADGIGINLPGGDEASAPDAPPSSGVATTSTTSSTTSTTTRTTSPTTTIATTTTTVVASTTSGPPSGPGGCAALDAAIVSVVADVELAGPDATEGTLVASVVTSGTVESVSLLTGDIVGGVALERTGADTWGVTRVIPGGASRGGERILVTALGCGFDEVDSQFTIVYGAGNNLLR